MTQIPFPLSPEQLFADVAKLKREHASLLKIFGGVGSLSVFESVKIHIFDGGKMPEAKTDGAIGYDAYARAVVDPLSKATADSPLRRTIADFHKDEGYKRRVDRRMRRWMTDDPNDPDKYAIALPKGKRAMVGLGFATEMSFPQFYWVAPRSGYAAKGITVSNSPGTVDPDYRGEAGALIENRSDDHFLITHQMRIIQGIFQLACMPTLIPVEAHHELEASDRGAGGFGSTGTHH